MRVTTKIMWDARTQDFIWTAYGPVMMCCSSGDSTAKNLETAQAAMTNTLNQDYSTTFAEQQSTLANLSAKLNYMALNPAGYAPAYIATSKTAINENAANAAKQAIGAAGAYAAAHGGADVGSGAAGQIAGQIATGVTEGKTQSLAQLSNQNELLKQQNFWNAISGLNSVGSQYGGAGGTAIGGATSTANSATNAGQLALATQQAGWQDVGGVISGISGLASTGAGIAGMLPKGSGAGGVTGAGGVQVAPVPLVAG